MLKAFSSYIIMYLNNCYLDFKLNHRVIDMKYNIKGKNNFFYLALVAVVVVVVLRYYYIIHTDVRYFEVYCMFGLIFYFYLIAQ